jgi:hypothetical protein
MILGGKDRVESTPAAADDAEAPSPSVPEPRSETPKD